MTTENDSQLAVEQPTTGRRRAWLRHLGLAGFLFFFIKGMVWVAVAVAAAYGWTQAS